MANLVGHLARPLSAPLVAYPRTPNQGGGAALPAYQQILALALADGWTAVYDPTNPDTRTLRTSGSDQFVTALADGLGNLATLVKATEANQPLLSAGAFGGVIDGMLGDGTDALGVDVTDIPQPFTLVAVAQRSGSGQQQLVRTSFSGHSVGVTAGNAWTLSFGTQINDGAADTNQHVVAAVANGASSSLRLDGAAIASGNGGTNALARVDYMGGDSGFSWNGLAGPLLIRSDADTAAIARMEALLAGFF